MTGCYCCRDLDFSGFLLRKTVSSEEPPSRYDLIAVSNHYGGLRDGHCRPLPLQVVATVPVSDPNPLSARLCSDTSYARHKDNGQWYYFDDSKVTFAAEDQIVVSISVPPCNLRRWRRYTVDCATAPAPPDQRRLRPVLPATRQDPKAHPAHPQRKPRLHSPARQRHHLPPRRRRRTGGRVLLHHHGDGLREVFLWGAVRRVGHADLSLGFSAFSTLRSYELCERCHLLVNLFLCWAENAASCCFLLLWPDDRCHIANIGSRFHTVLNSGW